MSKLFFIFSFILWVIAITRLVMLLVATWQLKEYRWDRMREYLRLPSTRKMLMSPIELAKWLLLFLLLVGNTLFGLIGWFIAIVYVLDFLLLIKEFKNHVLIRPAKTMKALLITGLSGIIIVGNALVFVLGDGNQFGMLVYLDRLVFVVVTLLVIVFYPLSRVLILRNIATAKKKRRELRQLRVIGITGSYGKSSTKNIIATLLAGDDLLVTPGNTNTEIGVAQFMLKRLNASLQYFVAEMGAYRLGEIEKLAKLVQPKIGVLTAVGNQHLGLFGSHENIRKAKYELIQSLPPDGTAIFNADDPICLELAKQTTHCEVLTYGLSDEADLQAQIINANENGVEIKVFGLVPETTITVPVVGAHQVGNVLAGILVAIVLGKNWQEIQTKIPKIVALKQTMEKYSTSQGAMIIDDSYNANVRGVIAAIENLGTFSQTKKIVILTPMIELGTDSVSAHREVGAALAKVANRVFYTGTDFSKEIINGAHSINPASLVDVVLDPKEVLNKLMPLLDANAVVLLEGRVSKLIRDSLHQK